MKASSNHSAHVSDFQITINPHLLSVRANAGYSQNRNNNVSKCKGGGVMVLHLFKLCFDEGNYTFAAFKFATKTLLIAKSYYSDD